MTDSRSTSRIKRKPPPAFPYSPRYPLPDPTDPFVSLQVLRDRAHSSQRYGGHNHSSSSLPPTPPLPPPVDVVRHHTNISAELPPLPRTVLHAARSIEAIEHLRDGYHSDVIRPPRPPRARARPTGESTSYFSDADAVPSHATRRQQQEAVPSDRDHRYRRRSQTISAFPATSAQPTLQDSTSPEIAEEHQDSHLSNQYVYDDRQSHGHVYGPARAASKADSHSHQHMASVQSVSTPPMTPDDTMTLSSASLHERAGSPSPGVVLQEPPSPRLPSKPAASDSDAGHAVPDVTVISNGLAGHNLSRILTSDFPTLLGKTEPDSPAPLPVPPPRPRLPPRAESEPEPDFSTRRRSRVGGRKDSLTRRFRRSSLYGRDRKISDPSPPAWAKTLHTRESVHEESLQQPSLGARRERDREVGPSTWREVPQVVRASGAEEHVLERKKTKVLHRKSLSHVSLGVTPLPGLPFGGPSPSPADNVSMASTLVGYPDSDEFGRPAQALLPPLPPMPVIAPQPQTPPPPPPPQTLAQALELTPLPKRSSPLPPIRKESRLPTPPRDERSVRVSRQEPSPEPTRPLIHEDDRRELNTVENGYTDSLPPESLPPSPSPDVVLLRPARYDSDELDYQQSSPSPPLSSNPLLSRPTSAFSPIPPAVVVPLISPSPLPPQHPPPNSSFSPIPPRSDPAPRRAPSPSPPRRPSPPTQQRRAPSPRPVVQQRRAPSPVLQPRRVPSPLPPPRHTPTPPAPRRVPSPLPPRSDEPPTPAPLPLSPPRRAEHDLPTPLPQPPLPPPRATMPVYLNELPRGFSAPRATEPVRPQEPPTSRRVPSPTYAQEMPRSYSPAPEPPRSRTPHENRHEAREQRYSEDHQERTTAGLASVAQVNTHLQAQPAQQAPPPVPVAGSSRTKPSGTPYNSVRQPASARRATQATAQGQYSHLPFRSETPPLTHLGPARTQSPEQTSAPRAQSPMHVPTARAQSPQPAVITTRGQSPLPPARVQSPPVLATVTAPAPHTTSAPAPAPTRVPVPVHSPPPPPAYFHTHIQTQTRTHAHMHSQPSVVSHDGENGTEEFVQTTTHNASQSTVASPQAHRQYATSTESTPLPLPHTPSTTISHPYRSNETATSAGHRSRATAARGSSAPPRSAEPHRRPRHQTEHKEVTTFDEHACLTREQMARAAPLTVVAQNGLRVPFGELVKERKTIVCFIRNFWCAMDQDYMYSIARHVDYQSLQHSKTDFIVIGNGSPGMISSYRRIFRTPIPVYTDPSLRLHTALGMTLRTSDTGPDHEKGEYIRHGPIGGLAMVVRNALRVGMPVWEKGGSSTQLGGEFVFGPGLNCSYAHRMTNTRSHAPILEVLMSAGHHFSIPTATNGAPTLSPEEEEAWMEERRRSLARMRAKREKRRINGPGFGTYGPALDYTHGSDTDSGSVSPHGSWASSEEKREMDRLARRARERQKERKRKAAAQKMDAVVKERHGSKVLGLHLSNPDDQYDQYDRRDRDRDHDQDDELEHRRKHHNSTRVHVAHHDSPDWSDAKPTLAYINELGRREDGYETGEESMPDYSYRRD